MSDHVVTVPTHLGFVLDGNRRWAREQGLPTLEGHRRGLETFKDIALATFDRGVTYVSAYIFSTENWQRTQEEVDYLMGLVSRGIQKHLKTFDQAGIKLVMLGSRSGIAPKILTSIDAAIATTKNNTRGTLALCFNYGGQQEIADAAQALVNKGESQITPEKLSQHMYEPDVPAIDLLIRTSGERRLSGFMLWRIAYSELYFSDTYWPAFSERELDQALDDYAQRQRRFGV